VISNDLEIAVYIICFSTQLGRLDNIQTYSQILKINEFLFFVTKFTNSFTKL